MQAVQSAAQAGVGKKAIQETLRPFCYPGNIPSVAVVSTFKSQEALCAIVNLTSRQFDTLETSVLRQAVLDAIDKVVQDATGLPHQGWREDELPGLYAALDAHEARVKKRLGVLGDDKL
jgi:hypothetical protein